MWTAIMLLIINATWVMLFVHSINRQNVIKEWKLSTESYHSFKPKNSDLKLRYHMAISSLPEKLASVYPQISALSVILATGGILWLTISVPMKIALFIVSLSAPYLVLEYQLTRIESGIDSEILSFLQYINAALHQSEDLIKALKYAETMIKNDYFKSLIRTFNQSIYAGLDERLAFAHLYKTAEHDYLKYVVLNFEQVYLRRGNLIKLISGLEQEYTAIQVEINKRKLEIRQDRKWTLITLVVVLLTAYKVMHDNDYIYTFYMETSIGNTLLWLLMVTFILGVFILLRATQVKY